MCGREIGLMLGMLLIVIWGVMTWRYVKDEERRGRKNKIGIEGEEGDKV